jgi:hypothetical protein
LKRECHSDERHAIPLDLSAPDDGGGAPLVQRRLLMASRRHAGLANQISAALAAQRGSVLIAARPPVTVCQ